MACLAQSWSSLVAGTTDGALRAASTDEDDSGSGLLQAQTIAQAQTMNRATMTWRLGTIDIGNLRLQSCR
ncbi:hypothetical protein BTHE68_53590 [Burkholderia sp. THE68]|nr:hypothetical protein BTHE68_53590 [Burkholderia sp. THE68]